MIIAIYCVEEVDLIRYNKSWLNICGQDIEKIILLSDEDISPNTTNYVKNLNIDYDIFNVSLYGIKRLQRLIYESQIEIVVINALSVPDLRFAKVSMNAVVKLVYFQHGLYIPFMERTMDYYIAKMKKVIMYSVYALMLSRTPKNFLEIVSIFVAGKSRKSIAHVYDGIDLALVFSSYWKSWHRHHYRLNCKFSVVGSPDFINAEFFPVEQSFVYCAQTLVEDGRIKWDVMKAFYDEFKVFAEKEKRKVVVKVHPRNSDFTRTYLQQLGFTLSEDRIPLGEIVVGHYSTLLPIWSLNGVPIVIRELPEHRTPRAIKNIASAFRCSLNGYSCDDLIVSKNVNYYFGGFLNRTQLKNIILNVALQDNLSGEKS